MLRIIRSLSLTASLVLALAGCVAGATSPAEPSGSASASSSIPASPALSPPASSPAPSSSSRPIVVPTAAEAARRVLATDSRFRSIGAYDPNLIGQAAWYRVSTIAGGFRVVVRIGWGDCPSGCIYQHLWTYEVAGTGEVGSIGESGPAVPSGVIGGVGGNTGGGVLGVAGRVTAGPTCPVMRNPPDPNCADRAVAGAVLVVTDDSGREVARVTSDSNGDFSIPLQAGHYLLTPQPVTGLMGTARPVDLTIALAGPAVTVDVQYDTGIR